MPTKYESHPLADIFPPMMKAELAALAEDIKANGLQLPIVLFEGKILDGRSRYSGCETSGIEPDFREYNGDQPLQYSLSLNLKRRNLTKSQRAAIAADLANIHREDTLKQNASDARKQATVPSNSTSLIGQCEPVRTVKISQSDAADIVGVSRTTVQEAVDLKKTDGFLFEKVKVGKMSLQQALRRAHPRRYKRHAALVASMKSGGAVAKALETETQADSRAPTLEDFERDFMEERQRMCEAHPEIAPEKLDEIWMDVINRAVEETPSHAQAQDSSNGVPELSEISGVLGGIRITLELTPQEFKILNQAVNPQCSDNEESAFAVGFVQSLKRRYQVIQQVR
jgi:hypothetical protein